MKYIYIHSIKGLAFSILLTISFLPLKGQIYNSGAAAFYADLWTNECPPPGVGCDPQLHNPAYNYYGNVGGDCANYVSQCLKAGGLNLQSGPGQDNLGCIPFCDNLHLNLINHQNVNYSRFTGATPPWFVTGDVVIYGDNSTDFWKHACIGVTNNPTMVDAHTNNRFHKTTSFYYNQFINGDFYHINSASFLDCSNAIPLVCGQDYNGNTIGGNSNISNYGCQNWLDNGPENVFTINTTTTGTISATLSNLNGIDLDVWILNGCDPLNCVGIVSSNNATFTNAPSGTYYIVVDGYHGASGSFTLNVTASCNTIGLANLTRLNDNLTINSNSITINTTIKNNGMVASPNSNTQFWLATDANFTTLFNPIGVQPIPVILASDNSSQNITFDLCNQGIPDGTYYVGYFIDYYHEVNESNEADNGWYYFNNPINIQCHVSPPNDEPCNAINVPVGINCSFNSYTNIGSTPSSNVSTPSCANYQGGDVWFTALVPTSGHLIFDSDLGTMVDGGMAIYTGSCNSLFEINCDDDASINGLMPYLDLNGLPVGDTVFIRFWGNSGAAGTYQLCVYDGGGCATAPAPNYVYGNYNPCVNDTITFSIDPIDGATGYHWVLGGGSVQIISGGLGLDTFFTVVWNSPGFGNIEVASVNNCGWSNIYVQNIFACSGSTQPLAQAALTNICLGNQDTLRIISGSLGSCAQWVWYANGCNVSTPIGFGDALVVSPSNTQSYYAMAYDGTGCGNSICSQVTINIIPPPTPVISGSHTICPNDTTILDAGFGYTSYNWSTLENTQTIEAANVGSYLVTVTDANGCVGSDTFNISHYTPQTVTITGSDTLCHGSNTILDAGAGFTSYLWSTTETSSTISVSDSGTYSVTITDINGCTNSSSLFVGELTLDTTLYHSGDSLISNLNNAFFQWIYCDSIPINGENNSTFVASQNGNYAVILNQSGCLDTSECYSIILNSVPASDFPNKISIYPNPTAGILNIIFDSNSGEGFNYTLTNLLGKIISSNNINYANHSFAANIDIKQFPSGIYFLSINSTIGKNVFIIQKQ